MKMMERRSELARAARHPPSLPLLALAQQLTALTHTHAGRERERGMERAAAAAVALRVYLAAALLLS